MAAVNVTDPVVSTQTGTMTQTVNQAQAYSADGVSTDTNGKHGATVFSNDANGSQGLSTDLARIVADGLIKDEYDDAVVKMGFSASPINAMVREMGSKPIKSLVYGFYAVGLRKTEDALAAAISALDAAEAAPKVPKAVEITVADSSAFDKTDVIFFDGVDGYDADGNATPYVNLTALVIGKNDTGNKLNVQFLNAKTGVTVASGTKIYILGHAAAEEDASTTPWMALPEATTQYMQKFMVQSIVSSVFNESNKEVDWTKKDVDEIVLEQLMEDIERFYIFGKRSYTFNPTSKLHTRTCAGILEQMLEGGAPVVDLYADDLTFADLLEADRITFEGNTGSNKRYLFAGGKIAPAIWGIKDVTKMVTMKEFKSFGYEFDGFSVMGYQLVHVPHPLLNKMGRSNIALVIDRAYLQRAVFRSLKDTQLELAKTGAYDGDSTVWQEISSPMLKYPKAHALWVLHEGSRPSDESSN